MGFLDKIWDETLAGPAPESGLGKLRKCDSFSPLGSPTASDHIFLPSTVHNTNHRNPRRLHRHHDDDHDISFLPPGVSRRITLLRSSSLDSTASSSSAPSSPAASSGPPSPFTPRTPREDFKRLTRKKETLEASQHDPPRY